MLILDRYEGEQVFIGDDVIVTVVALKGSRVRLGFAAPREIPIHREEIWREIHRRQHTDVAPLGGEGAGGLGAAAPVPGESTPGEPAR